MVRSLIAIGQRLPAGMSMNLGFEAFHHIYNTVLRCNVTRQFQLQFRPVFNAIVARNLKAASLCGQLSTERSAICCILVEMELLCLIDRT
jgi:hypothetical protein